MTDIEIKKMIDTFEREQLLLIYALHLTENLVDKGIISGNKLLTDKGKEIGNYLEKTNFEATREELAWAVENI